MAGGTRRGLIAIVVAVVAVLLIAALVLANCRGGVSRSPTPLAGPTPSATAPHAAALKAPPGMPSVALGSLPAEAQDVVAGIVHGGTFKYRQDGATFGNREKRLPAEPRGYYHEYTVATPDLPGRGPRRIIAGRQGEIYYTPDHYRSFQWIVREGSP